MGVIKLTQRLNQYDGNDPQIQQLANRQLKTEQNNIEHMKGFL